MKKRSFAVFTVILCLILLSSCSTDVLKTKDITDRLTQSQVVLKDKLSENGDFGKFLIDFTPDFTVPGLFEGFIPQGLCYDEILDSFLISGYYSDGDFPSMVCVVDKKTGKLTKSVSLKTVEGGDYSLHAGGIASSNGNVYIVSGNDVNVFSSASLKAAANGTSIRFESKFRSVTRGSFACIANKVLWIGDFVESSNSARDEIENITTLDSGETFYAYCEGYILEDGLPSAEKINSAGDGYIPDYMLAVPEQVQGMTVTPMGNFVFSTSYGRKNNSYIYIYDDILNNRRVGTVNVDGVDVDLFACSAEYLKMTYTAPPMSEALEFCGGNVYVLFESGAAKYRNGGGKYPCDTVYYAEIE